MYKKTKDDSILCLDLARLNLITKSYHSKWKEIMITIMSIVKEKVKLLFHK